MVILQETVLKTIQRRLKLVETAGFLHQDATDFAPIVRTYPSVAAVIVISRPTLSPISAEGYVRYVYNLIVTNSVILLLVLFYFKNHY